jgi:transcriptional regulator with GAF, ATPase, and Fis domain/tetratricopeptide (TPR) repeat protein
MPAALAFDYMASPEELSYGLAALSADGPWEPLSKLGEGATSVVWKARLRGGTRLVAVKIARDDASAGLVVREAELLSGVSRRWGPALIDVGAGYFATEWAHGEALDVRALRGNRDELAPVIAHALGRALEELHQAGVVHGDVKPANVILHGHVPTRDAAEDRGASLIDLGLAAGTDEEARGGTPRYGAPELRARRETGPAGDLWALGLLLAEVLDPRVAASDDPRAVIATWTSRTEPHRWVEALLAESPGGRPSAAWVARRAARLLRLEHDESEAGKARADRVRRTYLAERRRDLAAGAVVPDEIDEPARTWLKDAIAVGAKLAPAKNAAPAGAPHIVQPLGALRRARWLVSLVGASAAEWPLGAGDPGEGQIAGRAIELARVRDPSSFTVDDLANTGDSAAEVAPWQPGDGDTASELLARLMRELGRPRPSAAALALAEDEVAREQAPATLAIHLAASLLRAGEAGRAWAVLGGVAGPEADAMRAEAARRRGDIEGARRAARNALAASPASAQARATLARLDWDAGDLDAAERELGDARGPAVAEVRALVAWRRGNYEAALKALAAELAQPLEPDVYARLEATRGLLELSRGAVGAAARSFGRAVELSSRGGAVIEEATYLTSQAAATSDTGEMALALGCSTRAALLWERLGRPERAARAWLARAACLATIGAAHDADEAAEEARARAEESRDVQAAAYARWARVEVRVPGSEEARRWAIEADELLRAGSREDAIRSAARLLVWAPAAVDAARVAACDADAPGLGAATRWEWWGARAAAILAGRSFGGDERVLASVVALLDVPAPLGSRGPALDAAVRLARSRQDGDAARRLDQARLVAARVLREGTPPEHRAALAAVTWARTSSGEASEVAFQPAQVAQLESIVKALSSRDGLKPLLAQVLDTMILWTGVERGLLLLRAPDGRLVPRAARNLARHVLTGDQLLLSQTIARRALEEGDTVVATDAFSTLGDLHASVHSLKLRSVLAVPLVARGEALGVVYLDDRVRKGAFGPQELAWVRVVASQAAMAVADARDAVLLRRAARRAERARARIEGLLSEREAELDMTRTQLALVREPAAETRYKYDGVVGRSEPVRALLRLVDRVTASDVPVLVVGESGTGKELIARAMHTNGPRARRAFVSENCASVPETLLESTLFGHVRGAFTGASSTRAGLFEIADGGTLFLDEIGEMPLSMQVKLLRVLQEGEIRAVGGERARKVNVRVIGATHRDLQAMVAAGRFREDLLYRINIISVHIPSLRERPEDIPLLVEHFVRKHAEGAAKPRARVTRAALAKLASFDWPGNVRQLENEIRRALVLSEGPIDVGDLSPDVGRGSSAPRSGGGLHLRSRIDALEAELVGEALGKTRGNQTKAAQLLGLSRFGLQKMVKRLGIKTQG